MTLKAKLLNSKTQAFKPHALHPKPSRLFFPPREMSYGSGGVEIVFIDYLLVRIHFIIVMIRWTGLALWQFECLFPGSLTFTFL